MNKPPEGSVYIGDGVYAYIANYGIWLYAFDGYAVTDSILLEPEVFHALIKMWNEFTRRRDGQSAVAPPRPPRS